MPSINPTLYVDESAFPFVTYGEVDTIDYPIFYMKFSAFTLSYQILSSLQASNRGGDISLGIDICNYDSQITGYSKNQVFKKCDAYEDIPATTYSMRCDASTIQPMCSIYRRDAVTDSNSGGRAALITLSPILARYYNSSSYADNMVRITGNIVFDLYYCPYF